MRRITLFRLLAMAVLASGLSGQAAFGQRGMYTAYSLEWMTASSEVVVRASIVDIVPWPADEGENWDMVTLEVHETLKGAATKRLVAAVKIGTTENLLNEIQWSGVDSLWFLSRRSAAPIPDSQDAAAVALEGLLKHYHTDLYTDRLRWSLLRSEPAARGEFVGPPLPILNMRFQAIARLDEVLPLARKAAAEEDKHAAPREHHVDLPFSIIMRTGTAGDVNELIVPVDRRLETLARRWIASPQEFLTKPKIDAAQTPEERRRHEVSYQADAEFLRMEGAKALRYFKSDRNVTLLKSLLTSAAYRLRPVKSGDVDDSQERVYYVRDAAFSTLSEWGTPIPRPVLGDAEQER